MINKEMMASAFCDDILGTMDGVELANHIMTGQMSKLEVVKAAITRTKKINPIINAVVTETFDQALNSINLSSGPFAGVPSFIKDTDDVKGVPTLHGSRAVPKKPAKKSSEFVKQYKSLGFISLGKSAMPEFGLTATTEPLLNNPTCNPWHLNYATGGSSGGSAALVASGVVPIAHANDGGGSIRIPASCCGIVGLKPSKNRLINMQGAKNLPINISSQGILSRSVRDTATYYAVVEQLYHHPNLPKIGLIKHPGKQRLKIGMYTKGFDYVPSDSDIVTAVHNVGKVCENLGHKVEEISCPFKMQVGTDFLVYWGMLAFYYNYFGIKEFGFSFDSKKLESFTLEMSKHFLKNIYKFSFVLKRLRQFAKQYDNVFDEYDVLLCPVLSCETPKLGYIGPNVPFDIVIERVKQLVPFTIVQNIAGTPAISLPLARNQIGLPIGIQFATAYGHEKRLLEIALELEEVMPWPLRN